jgi:hypothetical protein
MDEPAARPPAPAPMPAAVARLLLVLAAAGLAGTAVCAAGWIWTARQRVSVETLDPETRQALVADLLEQSPGAFVPAWFHPPIGYTLRPGARITAWDDTFTANELGYRTAPAAKARGTLRVVFAGSSWTFGMGVPVGETVPAQFERLAAGAAAGRRVEAWNLSLPAYNLLHELAALEFFFDRLRPDAVVLCPTVNEVDSGSNVLPNGSLTRAGVVRDGFGADQSLVYSLRLVDSHQFLARWRFAFAEARRAEQRLRARGVPLLVHFTGTWDEPFAHRLVAESGLTSPYVITPPGLTRAGFRNPPPHRHATPAANHLYAQMVYAALAPALGWRPLENLDPRARVPVFGPADARREAPGAAALLADATERLPDRYLPSPQAMAQCVGDHQCATGVMGRATTILVRRRAGATRLAVTVRRLPGLPSLYPLPLSAEILSAAGGVRAASTVPAGGPDVHRFSLPLPSDVPPGAALDVVLRAGKVVSAPEALAPRSVRIVEISQEAAQPSRRPGRR